MNSWDFDTYFDPARSGGSISCRKIADSELDSADSFADVLLPASACSGRGAREEKEGSVRVQNAAIFELPKHFEPI